MTDFEYRVRWKREGRNNRLAIFQTEKAARDKAQRLVDIDQMLRDGELPAGLDHLYGDYDHMNGQTAEPLPPLIAPPIIERRVVDAWKQYTQITESKDNA